MYLSQGEHLPAALLHTSCLLGFVAAGYISKKLTGSDWTCVSGRCLRVLCIEGNFQIVLKITVSCLQKLILFDSLFRLFDSLICNI